MLSSTIRPSDFQNTNIMIWGRFILFISLNIGIVTSRRVVDCTRCQGYQYQSGCQLDEQEGFLYARSVSGGEGCSAECDTQMCDNTENFNRQLCTGQILETHCNSATRTVNKNGEFSTGNVTNVRMFWSGSRVSGEIVR